MSAGFVLRASRLATPSRLLEDAFVVVEGASVRDVGTGPPPALAHPVVDLGDTLVAPGLVDMHVHGGGGYEVNCATAGEVELSVREMARFHAGHGTTALVATTVSDSPGALRAAVQGIAAVAVEPGTTVVGSHLEGPRIAPSWAGAQFPGALRPPSVGELADLVACAQGTLRLVTLAPELDGASELIAAALRAGVVVSIGHTDADYAAAAAAFEAGARHVTHLFNAMTPIHHRRPGPVAAALADDRVSLEVIADGVHVHPALISLVAALAPGRLVLVTDAIGATGTAPGRLRLGPLEVMVEGGCAVLADHPATVAGSVLTMDRALAMAVGDAGVPLLTALSAASLHPADALGEGRKGRLGPGSDADMVVLDRDLSVVNTIVGGRVVHDPAGALRLVAASASEVKVP